ncbi:MAG: membrane protein insertase YidC [SAR324 cluster bacterium]|nr:membrane protein insertase YidC [SAR324 cluster bacterium]
METKTFLAIFISFVILAGWSLLFPPTPPEITSQPALETVITSQEETTDMPSSLTSAPESPMEAEFTEIKTDLKPLLIPVENIQFRYMVNTRGGILENIQLKQYQHKKEHLSLVRWLPLLSFVLGKDSPHETNDNLVELLNNSLENERAMTMEFEDAPELTKLFSRVVYAANVERLDVVAGIDNKLVLTSPVIKGLQVIKTFQFNAESYVMNYSFQVINRSATEQSLKIRQIFGEGKVPDAATSNAHTGAVYYVDDSIETESSSDLEQEMQIPVMKWLGLEDHYFIRAVAPQTPVRFGYFHAKSVFGPNGKEEVPYFGVRLPNVDLMPNKQIEARFEIFAGPKEEQAMAVFGRKLEGSMNMTLASIAQPLLALLRWIYGYVGNYGVAIIILTVIVRLVLFPLTFKGMKSMKKMQQLQPKMKRLQEKYKNNKEKLNLEMLEMYRKHKVNPLGGCLPLVLQIPIFFGLYSALSSAIELRHAPFIFWLNDLSARDGLAITPLLMGITMFFQQKMTPTTMMDPTQAKMMQMLPIIFTFFTFSFPSGLVIYWITSNILSIGQQYLINNIKTPEME